LYGSGGGGLRECAGGLRPLIAGGIGVVRGGRVGFAVSVGFVFIGGGGAVLLDKGLVEPAGRGFGGGARVVDRAAPWRLGEIGLGRFDDPTAVACSSDCECFIRIFANRSANSFVTPSWFSFRLTEAGIEGARVNISLGRTVDDPSDSVVEMELIVDRCGSGGVVMDDGSREGNGGGGFLFFASEYELGVVELGGTA